MVTRINYGGNFAMCTNTETLCCTLETNIICQLYLYKKRKTWSKVSNNTGKSSKIRTDTVH